MRFFVLLLATIGVYTACSSAQTPEWNSLKVTWTVNPLNSRGFDSLPRTEQEALEQNFTKISDCDETSHFAGTRYVKDGDHAVVLLYDVKGFIAGIQAGFPDGQPNSYPSDYLRNHPFVLYNSMHYITAYFVDPSIICRSGRSLCRYNKQGTGTDLYIQNGTSYLDTVLIPKQQAEINGTKWTRGRCFPTMGVHYWYNARVDMDCGESYPVFLLYNSGKLTGFGWAFLGNFNSTRYEHPGKAALNVFFKVVPECLRREPAFTTLHVYLSSGIIKSWC